MLHTLAPQQSELELQAPPLCVQLLPLLPLPLPLLPDGLGAAHFRPSHESSTPPVHERLGAVGHVFTSMPPGKPRLVHALVVFPLPTPHSQTFPVKQHCTVPVSAHESTGMAPEGMPFPEKLPLPMTGPRNPQLQEDDDGA